MFPTYFTIGSSRLLWKDDANDDSWYVVKCSTITFWWHKLDYLFNICAELDIDQWPSLNWGSNRTDLNIFFLTDHQCYNSDIFLHHINETFAISGNLCARFWSRPIISLWLSYLAIKSLVKFWNIQVTHILQQSNSHSDKKKHLL